MPPFPRGPNNMVKTRAHLDLAPSAHSSAALPPIVLVFPPKLGVGAGGRYSGPWCAGGEMPGLGRGMCSGGRCCQALSGTHGT